MTSRAGKRGLIGMRRKLLTHDNNFVDGANLALTWGQSAGWTLAESGQEHEPDR